MKAEKSSPVANLEPVEVLDTSGRFLAVVSAREAHRQSLPHRAVLVVLRAEGGKALLGKRPSGAATFPGRWDIPARGHLPPGQSTLEAARRLMEERHPGLNGKPTAVATLPPSADTGFESLAVFRCQASLPAALPEDALLVDREELAALVRDFRELLAPDLVHAFEKGILFADAGE